MALVGNGVRLATSNPMRVMAAPQGGVVERAQWSMGGAIRNHGAGWASVEDVTSTYGIPSGHSHPGAWSMPQKAGGMASRFEISGTGAFSGSGARGLNAVAAISASGGLSVTGQLIVSAIANLTGSGGIGSANLQAILNALANLTGSGTAAVTATGRGHLTGTLTGVGTATVTPSATGELAATITVASSETLTAPAIASAVWDALRAANTSAGSMGEALVELYRLAGLDPTKPLVVTATSRDAGAEIEQTVTEAPAGTVTVTRV